MIFPQAESNWAAYVPDLPGCIKTGKTLEELVLCVDQKSQLMLVGRVFAALHKSRRYWR